MLPSQDNRGKWGSRSIQVRGKFQTLSLKCFLALALKGRKSTSSMAVKTKLIPPQLILIKASTTMPMSQSRYRMNITVKTMMTRTELTAKRMLMWDILYSNPMIKDRYQRLRRSRNNRMVETTSMRILIVINIRSINEFQQQKQSNI